MSQRLLILRMTNQAIFFNRKEKLDWSATNFPKKAASFREQEPVYWLVNMLDYVYQSGRLKVEVLEYELTDEELEGFLEQKMKKPVRKLKFLPLDRDLLRAQLSYFSPVDLEPIFEPQVLQEAAEELSWQLPQSPDNSPAPPPEPIPIRRSIQFNVQLSSLEFRLGEVVGTTHIDPFPEPVSFRINNEFVIPEFEHIKGYFIKLLKRKTAEIEADLLIDGEAVELFRAKSPQVAAINQEMLQLVRQRRVRELLKPNFVTDPDKSLFTPDDLFESLSSEALGRMLTADGEDAIMREVFSMRKARNQQHLAWLASSLHEPSEPIRYTLRPQFGFLFFTEGESYSHFIWELLNSHATYIWSFDRLAHSPKQQYRRLEKEIAKIGQHGRMLYRRTDQETFLFTTVRHQSVSSKLVNGFPRWRNKLLEQLI
ncbi:MAG: hypothetical protein AAF433_05075 [Bacteroidota bacterium]